MKLFFVGFLLLLFLNTNSNAQFPVGDYFNPETPINSGDKFVWDIVNSTFNTGELIMIDQFTPFRDTNFQITVLQDLAVINYFDVLLDTQSYFSLEFRLENGTSLTANLDTSFTPIRPTFRVLIDGTAVNIFAQEFVERGEIEYGYYYLDDTVITRTLTTEEFIKVTEILNSQNELIHRTEERWDIKRGIRNYFEIKSFITQLHSLWILEGYDPNQSDSDSSVDDRFLDYPQSYVVGIGLIVFAMIKPKRTFS